MSQAFYVTTPIYYVNDMPHLGHSYTTIAADTLARFKRLCGYEVFFLTGTDEHGLKVQTAAVEQGLKPIELADRVVERFLQLWKRLEISNDDFIRTTQDRHHRSVRHIFKTVKDSGDIYLGEYEDWYCTPCESFFTELQLVDMKCPDCGRDVTKLKEPSYFFRLSKYEEPLLKFYEQNPDFVIPKSRYNEIVSFVRHGLRDLSVSRTTFSWGIPTPDDPAHVIYVWFDALTNYITALGYPDDKGRVGNFWPADYHFIGKDILKFHAIYWPAFLMSAGLSPPKCVVAHGWWTVEGKKMSKSLGNFVDPIALTDTYGTDAVRYFVLREVPFGLDGDFSKDAMIGRINSDLANDLGNLLSRSLAMTKKYFGGVVPKPSGKEQASDTELKNCALHVIDKMEGHMGRCAFDKALGDLWELVGLTNKYIDEMAPWALAKDQAQTERLAVVIYNILEAIRIAGFFLFPFMPATGDEIWRQLGIDGKIEDRRGDPETLKPKIAWGELEPGKQICQGAPLFPRIEK